jgi:hypothetical protein
MDNAYVFPAASRLVVHADDADGWWLTIELLGFNPTIDGYSAIQLGTTTLQDTDANLPERVVLPRMGPGVPFVGGLLAPGVAEILIRGQPVAVPGGANLARPLPRSLRSEKWRDHASRAGVVPPRPASGDASRAHG